MHVANRVMTPEATYLLTFGLCMPAFNGFHNFLMTLAARLFSDFTTAWRYVNVVLKPPGREIVGVPETIPCLGRVFAHQFRWRVAVVTDRYCPMT